MDARMMDIIMLEADSTLQDMLEDFERQWEGERWQEPTEQSMEIPGKQSVSDMAFGRQMLQGQTEALQSLMPGQQ